MAPEPARRPLPDVLARLTAERRSGRLRVRSTAGDRTVFYVHGTPTLATSTVPGERIAETLQRKGLIRPGELDSLLQAARAAGRRFDAHLVATGRIDADALRRSIVELSVGVLAAMLRESEGEPLFTALDRPVDDDVRIGRPAAVVWSQALERIPEEKVLRSIATFDGPPELAGDPFLRLATLPLEESDQLLLERADGGRGAAELARGQSGGERRGLRTLGWMRLCGLLGRGGSAAPEGFPIPPAVRFPWNRWASEELRRSAVARLRPDELAEREKVLALVDRCGSGLRAAGYAGDEAWSVAARLHPDQAHRDLFRDLGVKLLFVFPRLFDPRPAPSVAPSSAADADREERIRRRKAAGNHVELALLLSEGGQSARALDLLVRAAEFDPARTDLAGRFRDLVAARPHLAGEAIAALRPHAGSAPIAAIVAELERRRADGAGGHPRPVPSPRPGGAGR